MEIIKHFVRNLKETVTANSKLVIIGVSAGIGVVAVVSIATWYKAQMSIPKKWKRVGELSDLMCFPIKSCGVVRENDMECATLGLRKGTLRDRVFMVIDLNGKFITARRYPSLVRITPVIKDNILTLTAPGMMDHTLDMENLHRKSTIKTSVFGEKVATVDCGEEVARWFSRFTLSEDTGLRLVYYPSDKPMRNARKQHIAFEKLTKSDSGALPDCTSFMLISESSVADLNIRLEEPVTPQQFRPNFVVKGSLMYEEDDWDWVKIGRDAVFRNVRPCTRCIFTTIDPETGIKNKKTEPLITLKKYRQITDPALRRSVGESPVMGIHLGLRVPGRVRLGDSVYINVQE